MKFYHEINILKCIVYKNNYPSDFVQECIKDFLDRVPRSKIVVSIVPKEDFMVVLPFLGNLLLQFCVRIDCVMRNKLLLLFPFDTTVTVF